MIDIARRAGVARQTLYNHYPDIPSIVAAAAIRHNEAAISHLEQALAVVDTPSDTVRQLIRHIAAISTQTRHTLDSHQGLSAELRDHLVGFDRALEGHIREALSKGVEQGEFRPGLDIDIDTALVRHLLGGVSALVAASPTDAPRIVDAVTRTTIAALQRENPM